MNVLPKGGCKEPLTLPHWQLASRSLIDALFSSGTLTERANPVYLEVGNEPTFASSTAVNGYGPTSDNYSGYKQRFALAASGLDLGFRAHGYSQYRILTAGWAHPSPYTGHETGHDENRDTTCHYGTGSWQAVHDAIKMAYSAAVSKGHLGYALHPYGYLTNDSTAWQGFMKKGKPKGGTFDYYACGDLNRLLQNWLDLPTFFTEDNFIDDNALGKQYADLEAAYLIDLTRWLAHHKDKQGAYSDHTHSNLHVLWFTGQDAPGVKKDQTDTDTLGLYALDQGGPTGEEKLAHMSVWCSGAKNTVNLSALFTAVTKTGTPPPCPPPSHAKKTSPKRGHSG